MTVIIQIIFDGSRHGIYYPGQTVAGRIIINANKPTKARGAWVRFKGEARVHWTESTSTTTTDSKGRSTSTRKTVHYSATEPYFENTIFLCGGPTGEMELSPGQHAYQFQCLLPENLPSSFEGGNGHIRYTVLATLDRPWKFDVKSKAAFTVVTLLDLNKIPSVKNPVQVEQSKSLCCLCCLSGPLSLTVRMPVSGYVPGQTIPLHVEIQNLSRARVRPVNLVLYKQVTCHATYPLHKKNISEIDVARLAVDETVNRRESTAFSKGILVPAIPPSNLVNCGIIDLEYFLEVEAVLSGCSWNLRARVPIVLGNIPLLTGPTAFRPYLGPPAAPPSPVSSASSPGDPLKDGHQDDGDFSPNLPSYPELPPPSYEQSVFGGGIIKDDTDNEYVRGISDPFTPRYPVWKFAPSAPPEEFGLRH